MDLRSLRYFAAVAQSGSISDAARSINIAQPALTRQIRAFEAAVGTALFERTPKGVELTPAGQQLALDAKRILKEIATSQERARRIGRGETGNISVALPIGQSPSFFTRVLKKYKQVVSGVSITLSHSLSETQLEPLYDGRLDVGFLLQRAPLDSSFCALPIYSEKMLLAYPSNWEWDGDLPKSLRDLNDVDFVWLPRDVAPSWHDSLIHCFFNAGFTPKVRALGADGGAMLTLVDAGAGCSVASEGAKLRAPKSVKFLELPDLNVVQRWSLVWRKDKQSKALERFIEIAKTCINTE